ncbi:ATP-binding protein [Amycolatopsis anabasis]|uniref:ATP-binding protein n=1 Tax=Amycolatopsis anabasis TaxID=1840409 RepID=UPI00131DE1EF|nr:helix-turn-helix domain-containing protein [Amycolatopsis anabasis]
MTGRFSTLLRQLRRQAGMTQERLAERSGVGVRTIRGFETGERTDPRSVTVRLLADALDLRPAERDELLAAAMRIGPVDTGGLGGPVPRQLPAPPGAFVGRRRELEALSAAVDGAAAARGTVVVSAIGGGGGVGKTWLALHWAHQHLAEFPDGQLFADLRGFSPDSAPTPPGAAVRGFLDGLGVDSGRIPGDLQAQTALYRSLVAGKRMLIVLDNAADAEQVVPLLPGGDSCTVVITSRRTLTGLIARHSAHHLPLDMLGADEAHALLAHRVGADRVAAEPAAVAELVGLCGGLPLALGIIAGRANTHPHVPLAEIAAELREAGLDALADEDPAASLPAALSWSHRALTADQQRMFALLAVAPGADITLPAAASLIGHPVPRARKLLRELEKASLLNRDGHGRYAMHDLIRRYAADTAHQLPAEELEQALRRVVDCYLHTAHAADRLLDPHRPPIRLDPPESGCRPGPLPDYAAALAWFDAEHPCLLAAQHTATAHRWHRTVWQLAWTLGTYHDRRGRGEDRLAVWRAGLAAAEQLADPAARIRAHRVLGYAYAELGQHDESIGHLNQSLASAEDHHDHTNQAHTHRMLARAWGQRGDNGRALGHATHALRLYRTLGNPVWEAEALNEMGWHAARIGEYEQAREHCEAALTLHRRHDNPDGESYALDSLGYIAHHTGRHHQAVRHYELALTLLRDLGYTYEVANTLDGLGDSHVALGRHDQARAAWREALELYRAQQRHDEADRLQRQLDALAP